MNPNEYGSLLYIFFNFFEKEGEVYIYFFWEVYISGDLYLEGILGYNLGGGLIYHILRYSYYPGFT